MCSQCNDPPLEIKQNQPNEKRFIKAAEADHFGQDGNTDHCKSSISESLVWWGHPCHPDMWGPGSHHPPIMTCQASSPRVSWSECCPRPPMSNFNRSVSSWLEMAAEMTPRRPRQYPHPHPYQPVRKTVKMWFTPLLRANDKLSKVGTVHYTVYDGRSICEMSFEAILGLIFCKIEA